MSSTTSQTYVRSFNRFELKYVVHYEQVQRFLALIDPFIERDLNVRHHGLYRICSLYYDSPGLTAFWEKLDGVKFRRKLRVRQYRDDDPSSAFLEIKQRIDRTVQKRRTRGGTTDLLHMLQRPAGPPAALARDPVCQEARWLSERQHLEPTVITSYNREAYFGRYERGLRITVDKSIRWRAFHGRLDSDPRDDPFILSPHLFVVEIKCNDVVPSWLCSSLNSLDFQIQRFSKYCGAINQKVYGGTMM